MEPRPAAQPPALDGWKRRCATSAPPAWCGCESRVRPWHGSRCRPSGVRTPRGSAGVAEGLPGGIQGRAERLAGRPDQEQRVRGEQRVVAQVGLHSRSGSYRTPTSRMRDGEIQCAIRPRPASSRRRCGRSRASITSTGYARIRPGGMPRHRRLASFQPSWQLGGDAAQVDLGVGHRDARERPAGGPCRSRSR